MNPWRRGAVRLALCAVTGMVVPPLAGAGHAISSFLVGIRIDRPGEADGCSLSSGTGALSVLCGGTAAPVAPFPVFGNNNVGAALPETVVPPQVVPTTPVTRTPLQVPAEPTGTQLPNAVVVTHGSATGPSQPGIGEWQPALVQARSIDVVASPVYPANFAPGRSTNEDLRMRTPQAGAFDDGEGTRLISLVVDRSRRVQSPTVVGEYSSRTIRLGDREYLEMTVSW